MKTNQEYIDGLKLTPLPEQFADTIANSLGKKHAYYADSEYYPYNFLDVRLVMQHGGMVKRLDSWLEQQRKLMRFRSFISIYSVRQYDIIDNPLRHDQTDEYKAKASVIAAEGKLAESGELARNII